MPIEMPKGLPFSVDTWSPSSSKRHYFLTHAHRDHSSNITSHSSFPIYSTLLTKSILLHQFPLLDASLFLPIQIAQPFIIHDPDGAFTVTAFDANHCPGAVMFLFEGKFGNILHTGDCRLTPECLLNLPDKYVGTKGSKPRFPLDCVFLDCTFANFSRDMPSKHSAIQQVINCIWKHPDAARVYLTCNMLGQEEILVNVSQTFLAKIYVDKGQYSECFKNLALTMPDILCEDPASRFHLFDGSRGLNERAKAKLVEAKAAHQPEPLIIRPSAQWYACEEMFSDIGENSRKRMDEAVKDQFGVWHVCYTIHSSKEELEWALQLLAPRWVVSTTPNCRAMELNYVKKHCFNSKGALNNSMWKLLDMSLETSDDVDASDKSVSCNLVPEETPQPCVQTKSPVKQCTEAKAPKALPITLFGRARLTLQDGGFSEGGCNTLPVAVSVLSQSQTVSSDAREEFLNNVEDARVKERFLNNVEDARVKERFLNNVEDARVKERSPERKNDLHQVEKYQQSEVQEDTRVHKSASYLNVGSSGLSGSVKALYRSMNVPVPQPLPSLMDLIKSSKRAKRLINH